MSLQGPNSPSGVTDDPTVGTVMWLTPENAGESDDIYAESEGVSSRDPQTHYLVAAGFAFSIPAGAIITGVLVEVECKATADGKLCDALLQTLGGIGGTNPTDAVSTIPQVVTSVEGYLSLGSSIDLWGNSIGADDVNDGSFGVALSFQRTAADTVFSVDYIRMTVWYAEAIYTARAAGQGAAEISGPILSSQTGAATLAAVILPATAGAAHLSSPPSAAQGGAANLAAVVLPVQGGAVDIV